jgi:hypothetical protein
MNYLKFRTSAARWLRSSTIYQSMNPGNIAMCFVIVRCNFSVFEYIENTSKCHRGSSYDPPNSRQRSASTYAAVPAAVQEVNNLYLKFKRDFKCCSFMTLSLIWLHCFIFSHLQCTLENRTSEGSQESARSSGEDNSWSPWQCPYSVPCLGPMLGKTARSQSKNAQWNWTFLFARLLMEWGMHSLCFS